MVDEPELPELNRDNFGGLHVRGRALVFELVKSLSCSGPPRDVWTLA